MMTSAPDLPKAAGPLMARLPDTCDLVRFTPDGNAALAYEVMIPKGWVTVGALDPAPAGFAQPSPIGLFVSDQTERAASVSITVTHLPVEVNLEDWGLYICGRDGWTVFASEWLSTPSGPVVDVGSTKPTGNERQVMRTIARSDNGRIFMVSGV